MALLLKCVQSVNKYHNDADEYTLNKTLNYPLNNLGPQIQFDSYLPTDRKL